MKKSDLIFLLKEWEKSGGRKIVAIDGRCASGKTTLANFIAEKIACDIVHLDDFFLPPEKRTKERLSTAGGNVDSERLLSEILVPLRNGEDYTYRKFSCQSSSFLKGERVSPKNITVVEGSYSCHPDLYGYYDLHIFLDVSKETQKERILMRNKGSADVFFGKWIPLEEKYFAELKIKEKCYVLSE